MNKNKILIVEDEQNLRENITDLLSLNNFDIKNAANGQEALEILDSWLPDLIISDIMMPIMDGHTFYEITKETKNINQIPFIFLTAIDDEKEKEKCIINGVDLFLTKPFKIETLIKIIESKIERFKKIKNADTFSNENFIHQISTPLNGILDSIDILRKPKQTLEKHEVNYFYNSIKTHGESMNRTIKKSTLYQNLKNNKIEFIEDSYSEISNVFLKVKAEIANSDKTQATRILFKIAETNIKIEQEYLYFILFELINNTLKFSGNNKKIIVTGNPYNSEYYELLIQDFGIGFSQEELKKITPDHQGLGLGLYLSKILVQKSKGVFSIVSQKNVGTTIKMFFPLYLENKK